MKPITFLLLFLLMFLNSCKVVRLLRTEPVDRTEVVVQENANKIDFASLKQQNIYSFQERASIAGSRGIMSTMAGGLISLATAGVKSIIKKSQSRRTAEYVAGLNDLVFYDQLSTESPFDPVGMKFNGFTMVRMVPSSDGKPEDTALVAEFELDNENLYEILNNSTFRLRLRNIDIKLPKAKLRQRGPQKLNMDFEITFRSSYVNEQGVLFDNVPIGKFYFYLRDAPIEKTDTSYAAYYNNLIGKPIEGRSFIVPRSFGYHIKKDGSLGKSYSQGVYSIDIKVNEATRNTFITTLLMDNSDKVVEAAGSGLKGLIK
jgi:hypothetical protein